MKKKTMHTDVTSNLIREIVTFLPGSVERASPVAEHFH